MFLHRVTACAAGWLKTMHAGTVCMLACLLVPDRPPCPDPLQPCPVAAHCNLSQQPSPDLPLTFHQPSADLPCRQVC